MAGITMPVTIHFVLVIVTYSITRYAFGKDAYRAVATPAWPSAPPLWRTVAEVPPPAVMHEPAGEVHDQRKIFPLSFERRGG